MKAASPVFPSKPDLPERKIAESQDEYQTLPVVDVEPGVVCARFELDENERRFIAEKGYFYLYMWQMGKPLMPIAPEAKEPDWGGVIENPTISVVPEEQAADPHAKAYRPVRHTDEGDEYNQ